MFGRFVCALLGFYMRKFPENTKKTWGIFFWLQLLFMDERHWGVYMCKNRNIRWGYA